MLRSCRWIDDKTRVEIAALGSEDEVTFTVCPEAHMHLTRQQVRRVLRWKLCCHSVWSDYASAEHVL